MASILVIDDERRLREALALLLEHEGHAVRTAATGAEGVAAFQTGPVDVVLLDVTLPDTNGLDVLARLRAHDSRVPCIFITAYGSIRSAVEAMRAGGFDYVTKPFDNDELLLTIGRALTLRRLGERVRELEDDLEARTAFSGIVGRSEAITGVLRELAKVAASDATVLLLGESGTGKELAARSVHRQSRRAHGPFVVVNCGAIPATLAEAELFGHERGAFTDAREARPGRFEMAHRGTLFLDEVGELPGEVQAKLLRALQDHEIFRLGARAPVRVDVRIVAATNRNLEQAVADGQFREDLYWRLNVFPIRMPALRDRAGDLGLLVDHLIDRLNAELNTAVTGLSAEARTVLEAYDWPGNVRELENVLRRALILAEGPVVGLAELPDRLTAGGGAKVGLGVDDSLTDVLAKSAARVEKAAIEAALARHGGRRSRAAADLGINRRTLFRKMRQYGLAAGDDEEDDPAG